MGVLPENFELNYVTDTRMEEGVGDLVLHPNDMARFIKHTQLEVVNPGKQAKLAFKKVLKKKPEKVYSKTVHYVFNQTISYFDAHLQPDEKAKNDWLDAIDKVLRIDRVPADRLIKIIIWARTEKFWKINFLSMLKLRRKDPQKVMYLVVFSEQMKKDMPSKSESEVKQEDGAAKRFLNID